MKKTGLILGFLIFTSGCTHLASISTSSIPKNRNNKIFTKARRFIFLGLNFNNDYVNNIAFKLAQQCRGGVVQGVVTKHENVVYFPGVVHEVRIKASGYCLKNKGIK